VCILFDFPFNILYNMLLVYTLFCMLYVYSSVMEDKEILKNLNNKKYSGVTRCSLLYFGISLSVNVDLIYL